MVLVGLKLARGSHTPQRSIFGLYTNTLPDSMLPSRHSGPIAHVPGLRTKWKRLWKAAAPSLIRKSHVPNTLLGFGFPYWFLEGAWVDCFEVSRAMRSRIFSSGMGRGLHTVSPCHNSHEARMYEETPMTLRSVSIAQCRVYVPALGRMCCFRATAGVQSMYSDATPRHAYIPRPVPSTAKSQTAGQPSTSMKPFHWNHVEGIKQDSNSPSSAVVAQMMTNRKTRRRR